MAKMTLLSMVQNILSAMDSDAVNSISDTVESLQVAEEIIESYYELYAGLNKPSMEGIIELQPAGDLTSPTKMSIPENVKSIKWIRYNGIDTAYVSPEEFLTNTTALADYSVGKFSVYSDRNPTIWTTFDNETIYFNGFNNELDSTLQGSKTLCWGQFDPVYEMSDNSYAPYLDGDQYPGLLAEAKSVCFANHKQVASSKDEQRSKRQRVRQQNDEWRLDQRKPFERGPDFGRRRGYRLSSVNFGRDA